MTRKAHKLPKKEGYLFIVDHTRPGWCRIDPTSPDVCPDTPLFNCATPTTFTPTDLCESPPDVEDAHDHDDNE